jgi:hypothetical protein
LKAGKLTDEITDVIQTVAKEFQQNITNSVKVYIVKINIYDNSLFILSILIKKNGKFKGTVIDYSVSSTMQITSAMKMVSAAKKAQDAITAMRPYAEKINGIITKSFIPFEGE